MSSPARTFPFICNLCSMCRRVVGGGWGRHAEPWLAEFPVWVVLAGRGVGTPRRLEIPHLLSEPQTCARNAFPNYHQAPCFVLKSPLATLFCKLGFYSLSHLVLCYLQLMVNMLNECILTHPALWSASLLLVLPGWLPRGRKIRVLLLVPWMD